MNDFTKEELELILDDLEHAVFSRFYAEGKAKLRKKVQFMIDNYCDHNRAVCPLFTATDEMANAGLCLTCNTCVEKEFINDIH